MTHILHQIDHAIELLDDAYPSTDRSIRETLERAQAEIGRLRAENEHLKKLWRASLERPTHPLQENPK